MAHSARPRRGRSHSQEVRLSASVRGRLVRRLLHWYARQQRDLPWRRTKDPYRIWISEIMLQQTRVNAVVPYYRRFLRRFPTLASLARAPLDAVLKAWEGLGYYARARHLHAAARYILARRRGRFSRTFAEMLALPGIGRYTAGAIASIAFDQPVPVLDGNVRRVLCRVFNIAADPSLSATQKRLWRLAADLLPASHPGSFNQALMELGATVCTPRRPQCSVCPVSEICQARRLGIQETLPRKRRRRALPHYDIAAGVIWKDHRLLIAQRAARGLLGGLWEFPGGKREQGESLTEALRREIKEELGIQVEVGEKIARAEHAYTHFRLSLHVYQCRYRSGKPRALQCAAWRWVTPRQLDHYAFPAANRRVINLLQAKRNDA